MRNSAQSCKKNRLENKTINHLQMETDHASKNHWTKVKCKHGRKKTCTASKTFCSAPDPMLKSNDLPYRLMTGVWTVFYCDFHGANGCSIAPIKCWFMIHFQTERNRTKIHMGLETRSRASISWKPARAIQKSRITKFLIWAPRLILRLAYASRKLSETISLELLFSHRPHWERKVPMLAWSLDGSSNFTTF